VTPLEFTCPRCGRPARERFYGPCGECVTALRAAQVGEAREVAVAAYEPKMNVTPNNVASAD
jgi:NMD protein affecting ribosome stability and mRNA decay